MTFNIISCLILCTLALNFLPAQSQTEPAKCSQELAKLVEKSLAECEGKVTLEEETPEEITEEIAEETTSESPEDETEGPTERPLTAEERRKQREERQRAREERQKAREERLNARENGLKAREDRLKGREDRLKTREDRLKTREDRLKEREERLKAREQKRSVNEDPPKQPKRSRSERQAIEECLFDKIKIHEIGMELIRKCKEAELSPSLLDARILSAADDDTNRCLAKAINQC